MLFTASSEGISVRVFTTALKYSSEKVAEMHAFAVCLCTYVLAVKSDDDDDSSETDSAEEYQDVVKPSVRQAVKKRDRKPSTPSAATMHHKVQSCTLNSMEVKLILIDIMSLRKQSENSRSQLDISSTNIGHLFLQRPATF